MSEMDKRIREFTIELMRSAGVEMVKMVKDGNKGVTLYGLSYDGLPLPDKAVNLYRTPGGIEMTYADATEAFDWWIEDGLPQSQAFNELVASYNDIDF